MSGKRVNWIDVIEGRVDGNIFHSAIGPEINSTGLKKSNATPPKAETIELGTDPSLAWDIRRAARQLEYLLDYTPQYAEIRKALKELTDMRLIEVTDEQQKRYADVERVAKDILRRIREKEKEEEKDLPVIQRMTVVRDNRTPRKEKEEGA